MRLAEILNDDVKDYLVEMWNRKLEPEGVKLERPKPMRLVVDNVTKLEERRTS